MQLTPNGYAFLGLTAIVAGLVSLMVFAIMRFAAAARDARRTLSGSSRAEVAFLTAALQEAVAKLRAQERATAARAEASQRLSGEIISSLTAGLLGAGLDGDMRILHAAGRRVVDRPEALPLDQYRRTPHEQPLLDVVDECLNTRQPIVRRAVVLPPNARPETHLGVTVSPLFDHEAKLHGAICLFTDLTAVKELEA